MPTEKRHTAKVAVLLALAIGGVVAVAVLPPGRPEPKPAPGSSAAPPRPAPTASVSEAPAAETKDPFAIGIEAAIASDPDKLALVHRYISSGTDMLWPIQVAVIIQLTNQQKRDAMLRSFSVQVRSKDGWAKLVDAPPRVLDGVYLPDADGSLRHAARLNFRSRAFTTGERPPEMRPGGMVKGWAFFLFPDGYEKPAGSQGHFRVTVEDARGAKETAEVSHELADPRSFFFGHDADPFYVMGDRVDVSGLPLAVPQYLLATFRRQQSRLGADGGVRLQPAGK
jgi:hypothetical protein